MLDKFTAHPHAVGETYAEHAHTAASFGLEMIGAGLACLVHALLPWAYQTTASRRVRALYARMEGRRVPMRDAGTGAYVPDFAI